MKIMQEQPHYNITPEQGWSKMRPALDDAMPVGRRSHRFGFLWWSTSAVLMSGVVGLFVFKGDVFFAQHPSSAIPVIESIQLNSNDDHSIDELKTIESQLNTNSSIPAANEQEQKINSTKNESTILTTPSVKAFSPVRNTTKPKQTEPIASAFSPTNNLPAGTRSTDIVTAGCISNTSAIDPIATSDQSEVQTSTPNPTLRSGSSDKLFRDPTSASPGTTQCGVVAFQIVEALPVLNATTLMAEGNTVDVIYSGSVHRSRTTTPFIEPCFAVGGLIGLNGGIGGTASAGADLNVSRRLSVTAGVGYMTYTPDAMVFGSAKDFAASPEFNAILNYDPTYEGINTYVDGTSVNSAAGYNVINPLVENLRQWQVSAGLKWKMSGRFYVDGGVTIGFGTTAYSEYPIVSGDPLSQNPYVKIGNSLNTYDVIRSTMTSVYGGIGYSATKYFDVFANWTHGFDSYILSEPGSLSADLDGDSRTDYIRGLNLGLRYTL
jgi:hypothetical protein